LADRHPDLVLGRTRDAIALGRELSVREDEGRRFQRGWEAELAIALGQAELLAWPTLAGFPPRLGEFGVIDAISRTMEVNLAGLPALAQPVPTPGRIPQASSSSARREARSAWSRPAPWSRRRRAALASQPSTC